jgi:hypothetical protein
MMDSTNTKHFPKGTARKLSKKAFEKDVRHQFNLTTEGTFAIRGAMTFLNLFTGGQPSFGR